MTTHPAPPPLTPADCDLRDFPRMMLDITRLRQSDFDATPDDCAWRAGLNLWFSAWHSVPAGSLSDDEATLAKAAGLGRDLRTWRKVRETAMRGFVLCSDGRFYHETVCEFALEAWLEKLAQRLSSGAGNAKRWKIEFDPSEIEAAIEAASALLTQIAPQSKALQKAKRRQSRPDDVGNPDGTEKPSRRDKKNVPSGSQGTGTGIIDSDPVGSAVPADDLADLRSLDPKAGSWRLAVKVLMARGGYPESRARPMVGKWAKDHAPAELWQACEAAWRAGTLDPVSYINAALSRIAAEANDPLLRPTEARQRLWMDDYSANPAGWREHERGPAPGRPGCRVAAELQREYGIEPAAEHETGRAA